MRIWILCATLALGCKPGAKTDDVALPKVAPDTVVASWSVISRSDDRRSMHVVLEGSRQMITTSRSRNGTMMTVRHEVPEDTYARLVQRLRDLDCCSLASTEAERSYPAEAKPLLEINFGDVQCEVELWDREWREGRAKECGFAFARVHGSGFVPDPPVDAPAP
jgi:hypothetical protein